MKRQAMFYDQTAVGIIRCLLCPNRCLIQEGAAGKCRSRKNDGGELSVTAYGQHIGLSVDPIEKKPLYHYHPGSSILSTGANSCNLKCCFCQNYRSSQQEIRTREITPQSMLDLMLSRSYTRVAFTYTEPFTWYEFIYDFAVLVQEYEIGIVLVTNGYINPEPFRLLAPSIAAMNIDLKSSRDGFYRQYCQGTLEPVIRTITDAYCYGIHVEVTNLIIPNLNDSDEDINGIIRILSLISPDIPLHFSRYHPAWQCIEPPTSEHIIHKAVVTAKRTMKYVYSGNLPGEINDTCCPSCGKTLIQRREYRVESELDDTGTCPQCYTVIYGRFG